MIGWRPQTASVSRWGAVSASGEFDKRSAHAAHRQPTYRICQAKTSLSTGAYATVCKHQECSGAESAPETARLPRRHRPRPGPSCSCASPRCRAPLCLLLSLHCRRHAGGGSPACGGVAHEQWHAYGGGDLMSVLYAGVCTDGELCRDGAPFTARSLHRQEQDRLTTAGATQRTVHCPYGRLTLRGFAGIKESNMFSTKAEKRRVNHAASHQESALHQL
jgi:hypothetical protein